MLLSALLAAACSGAPGGDSGTATGSWSTPAGDAGPRSVGRLVHTWDQGQGAQLADLQALAPPGEVRLVTSAAERDRLRSASPLDQSALAGVDLGSQVVVIGGYPNCRASSHLEFDRAAKTLTFVVTRDEKVNCVWAPYTVDAIEIERAELGGIAPDDLTATRAGVR